MQLYVFHFTFTDVPIYPDVKEDGNDQDEDLISREDFLQSVSNMAGKSFYMSIKENTKEDCCIFMDRKYVL